MTKILVHDFSGHPFQVQLSRELARRGHDVHHVYCASYVSGRGRLEVSSDDPPTFTVEAVSVDETFAKYAPWRRLQQEFRYARRLVAVMKRVAPDVVIESNAPFFAKVVLAVALSRQRIPWVFWLQDLYSVAMADVARRRLGPFGRLPAAAFIATEGALLRSAAGVVAITPDFDERLDRWRVPVANRTVIPNWAPLDELPVVTRSRAWAQANGIHEPRVALYAGTLGLKHRPELLVRLADELAGSRGGVAVVSEGLGADVLRHHPRPNLHVLPFQPWDEMPAMLAAADVLLVVLEPSAGVFSVPSKLLTYLCAGRPIVASVPPVNLAARVIEASGAGLVVPPEDDAAFVSAVRRVLADDVRAAAMGAAGRSYAEKTFDIHAIADRFGERLAEIFSERTARSSAHRR